MSGLSGSAGTAKRADAKFTRDCTKEDVELAKEDPKFFKDETATRKTGIIVGPSGKLLVARGSKLPADYWDNK